MLISILALVGLCFIIIIVYQKGRKDGIKDTLKYMADEMKKREIDAEAIIVDEKHGVFDKIKKRPLISFLVRNKNRGRY